MTTAQPELYRGLMGVHIDTSSISSIKGDQGELVYRGYDINELANKATFEEVAYLLWNDDLPTQAQLDAFKAKLAPLFEIPAPVIEMLKSLPHDIHPMHALRTAVSMLGALDPKAEDVSIEGIQEDAYSMLAKFPTIVAAFSRIRQGLEPVAPDSSLSIAANFLYMRTGEKPTEAATNVMDVALVLHAEHGCNASTFTARSAASSLTDSYGAITAAVASLKGPLHGGANTAVMQALEGIGSVEAVEQYVLDTLGQKGGRVMGFGHRVYTVLDPRAVILRKVSKALSEESGEGKWFEMSLEMERVMDIEMEKKGRAVKPNVDFFSASVYRMLGFPADTYTPIFAVARISGWMAHLLEQYADNRIMRPRLVYEGEFGKTFTPIEERA